jgi:hypothetical protein
LLKSFGFQFASLNHRFIFIGEAIEELAESGCVQRLGFAECEQRKGEKGREEVGNFMREIRF